MAIVIIGFLIIALIDLPPLIKQKQRRLLTLYSVIFVAVLTVAVLQAVGVKLPSPMIVIGNFMKQALHLSY